MVFFTAPALANDKEEFLKIEEIAPNIIIKPEFINNLPENKELTVKFEGYFNITAYSSEVSQCDGAPCITANGFNLCDYGIEDSIAANFLPFGSKIKIPELFGEKVFVVRDRMNARYDSWIDIWMNDIVDAKNFGVKKANIKVLE
ncbi:MAG: 3D domain-containing protein [Planctomycetes bacterium]|nr:3D domain-containing protein [Planctomycetota bacterium]